MKIIYIFRQNWSVKPRTRGEPLFLSLWRWPRFTKLSISLVLNILILNLWNHIFLWIWSHFSKSNFRNDSTFIRRLMNLLRISTFCMNLFLNCLKILLLLLTCWRNKILLHILLILMLSLYFLLKFFLFNQLFLFHFLEFLFDSVSWLWMV